MIANLFLLSLMALVYSSPTPYNENSWIPYRRCAAKEGHHLLEHEWDCTLFYYCENGNKRIEPTRCAPGTEFSYFQQVCVHPSANTCRLTNVPPTTEAPTTESNNGQGNSNENEDNGHGGNGDGEKVEILPNGCPANGGVQLLPDKRDCNAFFSCIWGKRVKQSCPAGLHFNPNVEVCDYPEIAGCKNGNGDDGDNGNNGENVYGCNENGGNGHGDNGHGGSGEEVEILPNRCPANGGVQLLPDKHDCNAFFSCVWGKRVKQSCPAGLHFNPTIEVCDYPENAGCKNGIENGDSICAENCNALPWAATGNCNQYWRCVGQKAELMSCGRGLNFNSNTATCDLSRNVRCFERSS